jgi:hypothetical protein
MSKLYVCLDLSKYDEAIQACHSILDLKERNGATTGVEEIPERCIRAIVGGTTQDFHTALQEHSIVGQETCKRTLSRAHALLERLKSSSTPEPWLFETMAYFHEQIGGNAGSKEVYENLMKEYRALQTVPGWEKDDHQVAKICSVVSMIVDIQKQQHKNAATKTKKESLAKSKFLVRGVIQKVKQSRIDASKVPAASIGRMETLLQELEADIQTLNNEQ